MQPNNNLHYLISNNLLFLTNRAATFSAVFSFFSPLLYILIQSQIVPLWLRNQQVTPIFAKILHFRCHKICIFQIFFVPLHPILKTHPKTLPTSIPPKHLPMLPLTTVLLYGFVGLNTCLEWVISG